MTATAGRYICNVEVAVWQADQWLLIRRGRAEEHAAGTLALVGGKVEGEQPGAAPLEATARREAAEEAGLALASTLHYVTSSQFTLPSGAPVLNVIFCAEAASEATIQDPEEVSEIVWLSSDQIAASDAPVWTKEYVAAADEVRRRVEGWAGDART